MLKVVISYLLLKATQQDFSEAMRWLNGSLNGITMKDVHILFIVVVIFGSAIICLTKYLQVLELGDEFATATTGPISFVSFLAGPIASKLVGKGAENIIPSALVGALLVLSSDMIGQFVFSTRFPVGVITGILGEPYMIFLLICIIGGDKYNE